MHGNLLGWYSRESRVVNTVMYLFIGVNTHPCRYALLKKETVKRPGSRIVSRLC